MNVEKIWNKIKDADGLSRTLGMEFISTPEQDTLKARMGVGSMALCPGKMALGINISGNHVKAMPYGGTVTAYGKLVHKGHTLHVWHIDIKNDEGELISTVQVTNYVIAPKKD